MFTIEDLKQGRCAVINDGTLEELREVLRLAFSNSNSTDGLYKFYYAKYNAWNCVDSCSLPTQSVKDFLIKDLKRGVKRVMKSVSMMVKYLTLYIIDTLLRLKNLKK